ncbi:unnamed protein product [Ectocarpus sp. 12 AP-2014]
MSFACDLPYAGVAVVGSLSWGGGSMSEICLRWLSMTWGPSCVRNEAFFATRSFLLDVLKIRGMKITNVCD